ncbi:MAG: Bax inhibitor-1/YccA family protein [Candidatus Woesearchaeota archaeon]|nr:Bax inhibitor-1/YccA family protein [Candidatus Woesearchaeota archaeon]
MPSQHAIDAENARFFQKVYWWMFLGMFVSGGLAWYTANNAVLVNAIFANSWRFFALIIGEVALVFILASQIKKLSASVAKLMFLGYAALNGLTLAVIFLVYTTESIIQVFVITGVMFGVMACYGYFTKKDLSSWGSILFMGLIGLLIAMVVNLFLQSGMFSFIISCIAVVIFTALTAYDVQKIKKMNIIGNEGTDEDTKEAIMGALQLYLDFINLFLHLLRLLGNRK